MLRAANPLNQDNKDWQHVHRLFCSRFVAHRNGRSVQRAGLRYRGRSSMGEVSAHKKSATDSLPRWKCHAGLPCSTLLFELLQVGNELCRRTPAIANFFADLLAVAVQD